MTPEERAERLVAIHVLPGTEAAAVFLESDGGKCEGCIYAGHERTARAFAANARRVIAEAIRGALQEQA